jgi:DNA modification methylase
MNRNYYTQKDKDAEEVTAKELAKHLQNFKLISSPAVGPMTPQGYKMAQNKLVLGDAFNEIKKIKTGSIDLILTDPPFNLNQYSTGNIKLPNRKELNNDIANWDKDFEPEMISEELIRVLSPKGNMFIFTSYNTIGKWHSLLDKRFDTFQYFIWHKTNPTPKIYKNGFLNSCEIVVCCWNKSHNWNFTKQNEMHNFFQSSICMGKERLKEPFHPTQKPTSILKHLIKIGSVEGSVILDPFMGVGSTGAAVYEIGDKRTFIGIEKDKAYFYAAKKRLDELKKK